MLKKIAKKLFNFIKTHKFDIFIFLFSLAFSTWLMGSTFSYKDDQLLIKDKLYSDFSNHLSIIRSFSKGENWPPEYPHFPGLPIKYHFLFYLIVGILELIGLRIDVALNFLSVIGLAGLMISIYLLGKKITKSKFVGFGATLSVILNPSLSWIYYFLTGPNKLEKFTDLFTTKTFGSFGPYDDNLVSTFWNLNIFTNQRHFAFSLFAMFIAIWLIIYTKGRWKLIIAILILALMSWMHKAVLMMAFIVLGVFFVTFPKIRKRIIFSIIVGLIVSLPGLLYLSQNAGGFSNNIQEGAGLFIFDPGFLFKATTWWEMTPSSDLERWLIYWFLNFGLLSFCAIFGFIFMIITKKEKSKIFNSQTAWFWAALAMFVVANLFRFGPDMANNHKLINFTIFIWAIYAFYFIKMAFINLNILGKILGVIIAIGLLFGGFCDLFPIINDNMGATNDIAKSPKSQWIMQNTKPNDVFLNFSSDFTFVLLTGRKIYLGVPYFNWSLGYPVDARDDLVKAMIKESYPKDKFCDFLKTEDIQYFYTSRAETRMFDQPFDPNILIEKFGEGLEIENTNFYMTDNVCRAD